jgi:hypothetical protein
VHATGAGAALLTERIRQLEHVLYAKRDRALELGAADTHGGRSDVSPFVVMCGDDGAVRASIGATGMRLFVSQVPQQHYIVDISSSAVRFVGEDGPQPDTGEAAGLVAALTELAGPMEVAPQVQVPYGFADGGEIVGFMFMTEVDLDSEGTEREDLGLNMDTYFLHDPRESFPFVSEANRANWLKGFWQAAGQGQVISLTERIRRFSNGFWACRDEADVWLEFDGTDGHAPAFVADKPYRSWDPQLNSFSKRQRRGETIQRNQLNGWFR